MILARHDHIMARERGACPHKPSLVCERLEHLLECPPEVKGDDPAGKICDGHVREPSRFDLGLEGLLIWKPANTLDQVLIAVAVVRNHLAHAGDHVEAVEIVELLQAISVPCPSISTLPPSLIIAPLRSTLRIPWSSAIREGI